MPEIVCATGDLLNDDCSDRGGIRAAYWTERGNVDLDTMLGDPLLFEPTNQTILNYAMVGGATFNRLEFEPEDSFYEFTYTEDVDMYEILVTMLFRGKNVGRRNVLAQALLCCDLFIHIFDYLGNQRVIGTDYNGVVFNRMPRRLRIGRHLDASGQLSQSKARDELDFTGRSFYAPMFAEVDEASIPLV